ncbi:hypothetical protein ACFT4A_34220 [Streptomyces sp. NPDC057099]|uniref:hypothetical protein n=1 Tax=Streptomyces sp. NPDC057099 TaxID=3346019 RepID=UPI00363E546E
MAHTIPLRAPLDESELPPPTPAATAKPGGTTAGQPRTGTSVAQQGVGMLGITVTITADEHRQIWERLTPHLPRYLTKVENHPSGWGLRFEFAPFTGREEEPARPRASYEDPRLRYVPESEDATEHRLREAARHILGDLYDEARKEWKDAAYVADLRQAVQDAPDRWKTYEREMKALQSAYDYLRTPQAGPEWPAAISRLVDAQERALAAAVAFDDRAVDIARVHDKHLYADLSHAGALAKAGYPEGAHWHIGSAFGGYLSGFLAEEVGRLIKQQEDHITKVARLAGTARS